MKSLTVRLTLAFLAVSLVGAVLAALFARWTTSRQFDQFVLDQSRAEFVALVTAYYQEHRAWDGIRDIIRPASSGLQQAPANPPQRGQPAPGGSGQSQTATVFALADNRRRVILPAGRFHEDEVVPIDEEARGVAVVVDSLPVGTVLTGGNPPAFGPDQERFIAQANEALIFGGMGAAVIAVVLGIILARTLAHPLAELTTAIRAMSKGQLDQKVPVRSQDEIGELAVAFNQMSDDLQRTNQQRRQMTADIAHDLRTPLTVIAGYVESMRDGVLAPTPERYDTIYGEVQHLQHLVEDLRTLSLADAGELRLNRVSVHPRDLLEPVVAAFSQRADSCKATLRLEMESNLPNIMIDVPRMNEVFANLVSNALRYTSAGGSITLSAQQATTGDANMRAVGHYDAPSTAKNAVMLKVIDDGAGIAPEALPHIFERFYRADASRTEQTGESGLGLAIARSIVTAHGGTIEASSTLGHGSPGTTFTVTLACL